MTENAQEKSISTHRPTRPITASAFLVRKESLIPWALFAVFLAMTLPGISWGTWHPDEIVTRSMKALQGEWQFSETNFDYPDLPQYTMYWLGKAIMAMGYRASDLLVPARILSAVLFGLTIVLTYHMARRSGGSITAAGLSGLFLLCVSALTHNARFAHNDSFLVFFTSLSILLLLRYHNEGHKGWLYAAFLTVGMAASSKYIGGSLLLALVAYYLFSQRKNIRSNLFSIVETLFVCAALTLLGYAMGTPKALFWMTWYFKRVFAALQWQIEYGHTPDAVRGIVGQYQVLLNGLGLVIFVLFSVAFLWACAQIVQAHRHQTSSQDAPAGNFSVLLLALLALDLPMLVSYNYQFRYFLTILPILAIFSGFFVERIYTQASQHPKPAYANLVIAGVALIAILSFARLVSVALLFVNDSRLTASDYLKTLPTGTSLEHTSYAPDIPLEHFEREHNYPVYFIRNINDEVPTSKKYKFNAGEDGLNDRSTTYFITDSFTANKFNDPYTCSIMQVECDFFKQLATGQSQHYQLIAEFSYRLPAFLPQISLEYVNPTIRIYERTP